MGFILLTGQAQHSVREGVMKWLQSIDWEGGEGVPQVCRPPAAVAEWERNFPVATTTLTLYFVGGKQKTFPVSSLLSLFLSLSVFAAQPAPGLLYWHRSASETIWPGNPKRTPSKTAFLSKTSCLRDIISSITKI